MNVTRRRGRIMIMLAWLAAGVFALPQTFVFRVLKHPKIEFYQCTSMGFFSELMGIAPRQQQQLNSSEILSNSTTTASTFVGNITEEDFLVNDTLITDEDDNLNGTSPSRPPSATVLGLGPEDLERVYSSIFLVAVYMVPLLVIVVTYANILAKIIRKRKASSSDGGEENQGGGRETRSSGGGGHRGSTANGLFGYSFKSTTGGGSSARRHLHRPRHNRFERTGTNYDPRPPLKISFLCFLPLTVVVAGAPTAPPTTAAVEASTLGRPPALPPPPITR